MTRITPEGEGSYTGASMSPTKNDAMPIQLKEGIKAEQRAHEWHARSAVEHAVCRGELLLETKATVDAFQRAVVDATVKGGAPKATGGGVGGALLERLRRQNTPKSKTRKTKEGARP